MMNRDILRHIRFDPALSVGARNATRACLRLQRDEQLTLIADREGLEIAAALVNQIEEIGAPYRVFVLEDAATLICFDARTGRRIWRRTSEPRAEDPAVTAEIEALHARAEEFAAQIAELGPTPLARRRALEKRGQTPAQAKESLDQLVESFDKQFRDLRVLYKSKLRLGSSWLFYISQSSERTIPNGIAAAGGWPAVIFNHGYISPSVYRTTEKYLAYQDAFARAGYVTFKSDYRGHGNSEGNATGGYGSNAYTIDVLNAVSSIKKLKDLSIENGGSLIVNPEKIGMWGIPWVAHNTKGDGFLAGYQSGSYLGRSRRIISRPSE